MNQNEVSVLLKELEFYLTMYPTYKACHANMTRYDRMIAKIIKTLKDRGADTPNED